MEEVISKCCLTGEQRKAILEGIKKGKERFNEIIFQMGELSTKKNQPFLQYDLVNTEVENSIKATPRTGMEVYPGLAGFHPYIVLHDTLRNVFVLVLKLSNKKYLFDPSGYRGEFASSNVDRFIELGFQIENLQDDYEHQYSLPLGEENQPFGIIVCYDGYKDIVYEGALRPDQGDWLYKEDITDYIDFEAGNVTNLRQSKQKDEIELRLKDQSDADEILLKLKK